MYCVLCTSETTWYHLLTGNKPQGVMEKGRTDGKGGGKEEVGGVGMVGDGMEEGFADWGRNSD